MKRLISFNLPPPPLPSMPEFTPFVQTYLRSSSEVDHNPISNPPKPTRGIRYALAQPTSQVVTPTTIDEGCSRNFAVMKRSVEIAHDYNAQLITFNELTLSGYEFGELDHDKPDPSHDQAIVKLVRDTADHLESNYYQEGGPISSLAVKHQIVIVATGPMHTIDPSGKRGVFDGGVVFGADGSIKGRIFKVHLWGFSERNWFSVAEFDQTDTVKASKQAFPVFEANQFPFSVGVCFDADYPEASRCMTLNGSLLNCFPTASPTTILPGQVEPYPDIRQHHIPTNAMQNQCFCSYGNRAQWEYKKNDRTGQYDPVIQYDGNSVVCDPYGKKMVASTNKREHLLIADCIICDYPSTQPAGVNYITNRRPELYSLLTAQHINYPYKTPSGYTYQNPVPRNENPTLPSDDTPVSCTIPKADTRPQR